MPDYTPLFNWVRERESVRQRKDAGQPFPWTADPIIGKYRFCNVRREDDRGTVWIRKHVREPFADHPNLWLMLCIARQINWPDTLQCLITNAASGAWPSDEMFRPSEMADTLEELKSDGTKVYTGAYMISAPAEKGRLKQDYIANEVVGALWDNRHQITPLFQRPDKTLRLIHERLTRYNGWGDFMAYQAVVDMRFTALLSDAGDVSNWCAAGPGTLRGLNRIYGRPLKFQQSQGQARLEMQAIYRVVRDATGVDMDFSDVPNILCETDKYLRVQNGEGTPRALYVPGRGH